jgi:hypothetical protein
LDVVDVMLQNDQQRSILSEIVLQMMVPEVLPIRDFDQKDLDQMSDWVIMQCASNRTIESI